MSDDYPSMTTAVIRSKFLNFFEERGLKLYPSSSLVPDDPSLLLANAGMNQFKEYYQGKKTMKEIGAISCQKCVRTNDIDCIGEDGRHMVTKNSYRMLNTLYNLNAAAEPNLSVLCSENLP